MGLIVAVVPPFVKLHLGDADTPGGEDERKSGSYGEDHSFQDCRVSTCLRSWRLLQDQHVPMPADAM